MVQNNTPSLIAVLEVFFKEPNTIHFIKEISRKIKLAPTSVRNNIKHLLKSNIIIIKKSKPFDGYIANRDNVEFLWYKRVYNLYILKDLTAEIINQLHPRAIILFGSYSKGEDVETSDIDIIIISKVEKQLKLESIEKKLQRNIHLIIIDDLSKLDKNIHKKTLNGIVLHGEI